MMPRPRWATAVSLGVAAQLGRAAAGRAHAGLVGAGVERVEDVVVVAVGEELEAEPQDAAERAGAVVEAADLDRVVALALERGGTMKSCVPGSAEQPHGAQDLGACGCRTRRR